MYLPKTTIPYINKSCVVSRHGLNALLASPKPKISLANAFPSTAIITFYCCTTYPEENEHNVRSLWSHKLVNEKRYLLHLISCSLYCSYKMQSSSLVSNTFLFTVIMFSPTCRRVSMIDISWFVYDSCYRYERLISCMLSVRYAYWSNIICCRSTHEQKKIAQYIKICRQLWKCNIMEK